jgi:hypothetical protein
MAKYNADVFSDTTGPLGAMEAGTSLAICTDPVSGVAIFPLSLSLIVPVDVGKALRRDSSVPSFFFFALFLCFSISTPICCYGYVLS